MKMTFNKVAMIGLGYIGLPTAAVMASRGLSVIGVDTNKNVVNIINSGGIHIIEPELEAVVHEVVRKGLLKASTRPEEADAFLIAVPTPFMGDHEPDLSFVSAAVRSIAPVLKKGDLVILESTSPVGTTEKIAQWLADCRGDLTFPNQAGEQADVNIAYCPERVLPGNVIHELVENDRVVGGITPFCAQRAKSLYKTFVRGACLITNARTAEMCKLTENSFRDLNIAFANELSIICQESDIDVWDLINLANHHPRVNILLPGPGVGGHCIAVDPWFIVHQSPSSAKLIKTARLVNDSKPQWILEQIENAVNQLVESGGAKKSTDVTIACFGLAFKPNIDDFRESPSLNIVKILNDKHAGKTLAVDPNCSQTAREKIGDLCLVDSDVALQEADIIVFLVKHNQFFDIPRSFLESKKVIDAVGLLRDLV
jgi:UDP-N-acetyl-D-mannosaminuronic acid dehydrogenase